MITEVYINSIEELLPLLTEQDFREDLHRNRSSYIYRGVSDASYKMETSLRRNCKHLQQYLEPAILGNFAKYAVNSDPTVTQSIWHRMIIGQHYGLPTRLLDWTHSALVGLHFAVTENDMQDMDQHDCLVWRIDMDEIIHLLPAKYRNAVEKLQTSVYSVEMLSQIAKTAEQYDTDMGDHAMVVIEPPSTNARIVNQYSFFSVIPTQMTDIETFLDKYTNRTVKYVISKEIRWRVRDMLDQLNMSERIVYPGLEGLSKWIARHYYVK